jgi:RNA-binding protein
VSLSSSQKKRFRAIGHHLQPVLIVSERGLQASVLEEASRALADHELIKVKVNIADRQDRQSVVDELCKSSKAELVQTLGNMALLYSPAETPNPKLSNLLKF